MKSIYALLILAMLSLGGCLLKQYTPVPGINYNIESRYAIVQTDSLLIYVRPQYYSGDAQSASTQFFSLNIRVKNISSKVVKLPRESFSLIAEQNQFDYIPLQIVLGSIQSSYLINQFEDPFSTSAPESENQALIKPQDQYFELVNSYFSFGDVLPGGTKEGYLFYNEKLERYKNFELDVLGTRVQFTR